VADGPGRRVTGGSGSSSASESDRTGIGLLQIIDEDVDMCLLRAFTFRPTRRHVIRTL
jgi:hypothetical protein